MMKTVFIFGAGASQQSGAPLMADFLDRANQLAQLDPQAVGAIAEFELVRRARVDLAAIHSKSYLDLDNVETLFSAIEMGLLIEKFPPDRSAEQIAELRKALIITIYKTIERLMPFPWRNRAVEPPRPYGSFAKMLRDFWELAPVGSPSRPEFSFLTFNYDLGLDYALHHAGIPFDYWLSDKPPTDRTPLLKLHGSINWGRCDDCGGIDIFEVGTARFRPAPEATRVYFDLGSRLSERTHCEASSVSPLLVPPAWDKTAYHEQVSRVWKKAASELSTAESIFIIGYSLPDTDSFFRYLFALGSQGEALIKRFVVVNPDSEVRDKFESMIGQGIRNRFELWPNRFVDAVALIKANLATDHQV